MGGSSFALARAYSEVHGIELSQAFVDTAKILQREGHLPYQIKAEGDIYTSLVARVPSDVDRSRIHFGLGDAMALPQSLGTFDGILVANVVCRLPNPASCLQSLVGPTGIVRPGGLIMFTTPFSWKDEFTPKVSNKWLDLALHCFSTLTLLVLQDLWLGGRMNQDGTEQWSLDGLKRTMAEQGMELVEERDLPLLIRQHSRLYEFIGAHATIWRKQ